VAGEKSLERLGMVERRKQLALAFRRLEAALALAACLIHERNCLLLDEPTRA